MENFTDWLRSERERLGLTQQDVAAMTGMAVSAIGAIEQGRAKARRSTEHAIRRALQEHEASCRTS